MTAVGKVSKVLSVKIDGTEYNTAITGIKEIANRTTQTTTVASGETASDTGPTTWQVEIAYNIDWATGSLHRLLLANDGEEATLLWIPDPDLAATVGRQATVRLVAPGTDATVGSFQATTITLEVLDGGITTVDPTP